MSGYCPDCGNTFCVCDKETRLTYPLRVKVLKLELKIEKLERELHQQRFNNKHNLSIDQTIADKLAGTEKELAYFKAIYNSLIDGAARDTNRIKDLENQLEQQQIMNPISVQMLATISDLSWKLSVAMKVIEMQLSPIFDNECEGCREAERVARDALKEITNVSEKDKA